VLVGMLVPASPAIAGVGSLDSASTGTFVSGAIRVERAALATEAREKAAVDAVIGRVQTSCPDAVPANLATGSQAQRGTLRALQDAAAEELILAVLRPDRSVLRLDIAQTAPLRWTSADLKRRVAAYVRNGRGLLGLHAPDLCAQARAAAQTGFRVIPPRTKAFVARSQALAPASASTAAGLAQRMKPLATPDELAAIKRLSRLQAKFDGSFGGFVFRAFGRLERALSGESGSRR
jgi:hypothetical protein